VNNESTIRLAFVVPALNEARYIDACLSSIEAQMESNDDLLVVDNGSTDGTVEIVEQHDRARVAVVSHVTIAALRNYGARNTSGEIIAFIDADCTIAPGWREVVVEILSRNTVAATGSLVGLPTDAGWIARVWWYRRPTEERSTPYLVAANFAVRREAFDEVGGFREHLVTDEDTEISIRLTDAGHQIIDSSRAKAIHHDNPGTLAAFYRKEKWHATSMLQTAGAQKVDKPMAMTIVFWVTLVLGLTCLIVGAIYEQPIWWGVLVILLVPVVTAVYRIAQGARISHFLQLSLLYLIFYLARSAVVIGQTRKGRKSEVQRCL
jgi:glycosyltransferase involved in cell wall biosynthesis